MSLFIVSKICCSASSINFIAPIEAEVAALKGRSFTNTNLQK